MHKPFFNIAALTNADYPLRVNKFSFVIVEPLPPQKGCGHHRDEDKTASVTYSYSSTSSEFLLLYFFHPYFIKKESVTNSMWFIPS